MKKYLIVFLIVVSLIGLSILGISHAEEEELIHRSVLIEKYGLEDSEMLDMFIQENMLTEASLTEILSAGFDIPSIRSWYESFVQNKGNEDTDFHYLLEGKQNNEQKELLPKQIIRIAFFRGNNSMRSLLFDLVAEKIYFDEDCYFFNNVQDTPFTPLTSEKAQLLFNAMDKVTGWEACYESYRKNNSMIDGWSSWVLAVEFTDGSIRRFEGSGSDTGQFPENFFEVHDALWEIVE